MKSEIPKTEQEFDELMDEIEDILKNRNIPIYSRPIHAFIEIAKKLKITIPFLPFGKAVPGIYHSDSLSAHIHDWYARRYGDRLNVQMGVGNGIILIRKDPWQVVYPRISGTVSFVCESHLSKYKDAPTFTTNGIPLVINILNLLEDMSENYAKTLTTSELKEIKHIFLSGLEALSYLDMIKSKAFIKEAKIDLENAVNNILSQQAHYGQSKWASLQFSEKLLKCFLTEKSVSFPRTHQLLDLYNLAVRHGLSQFSNVLLTQVQCGAGARYGEEEVNLDEAVKAHYSSLAICFFAARGILL